MAEGIKSRHAARKIRVAEWGWERFVAVVRRGITETFGKWIGFDLQFCYLKSKNCMRSNIPGILHKCLLAHGGYNIPF